MATVSYQYRITGTVTVDDVTLQQAFIGIPRVRMGGVTDEQVFENDQQMAALAGQLPREQVAHDVLINAVACALRERLVGVPEVQLLQGLTLEIEAVEPGD